MIRVIDKRIERALGRIRKPFRGRGSLVNSGVSIQLIQGEGLSTDNLQGAELMQHYGVTTSPPPGFMFVSIPIGGKTAHSIIVATEHGSYRLKGLKSGEVALYTDEGDSIILKRGNLIEATTKTFRVNAETEIEFNSPKITCNASENVDFNTPEVNVSDALNVAGKLTGTGGFAISGGTGTTASISGNLDTTGSITNNGKNVGSLHTHGGVQPGGGVCGVPI